jgi:hypothetical protein
MNGPFGAGSQLAFLSLPGDSFNVPVQRRREAPSAATG